MITYRSQDPPTLGQIRDDLDILKPNPMTIDHDIWRELCTVKNHEPNKTLIINVMNTPPKGRYCISSDIVLDVTKPGAFRQTITICRKYHNCNCNGLGGGSCGSYLHWILKNKDKCEKNEHAKELALF